MEPDDIGVVLTRASELHASICDAIDRVAHSRYAGNDATFSHGLDEEEEDDDDDEPSAASYDDEAPSDAAVVAASSSSEEEVRSLEGIREALEVLETQLESLQAVQQQQRRRKDAALAELEESRRVLLLRLKEHEGRETQVVEEAMTFAGEPVKQQQQQRSDDLALPPYLHPVSSALYCESPVFRSGKANLGKPSQKQRLKDRGPFDSSNSSSSLFLVDETATDTDMAKAVGNPEASAEPASRPPASSRVSSAVTSLLSLTGKTLVVVVTVVAFMAVAEFTRHDRRRKAPNPKPTSSPAPLQNPAPSAVECPPGYKRILDDDDDDQGVVKCIVKERVELPFPRALKTPDVLHGRG